MEEKETPAISDAEYEVMKAVWSNYPVSTNEVVDMLLATTSWNARTIQTLLARLVKKNALSYEKQGRVYVYTPLISQEQYLDNESSLFLQRYYGGALDSMILNFIDNDRITPDDITRLKQMLEDKLDDGGK